MLRDDLDRSSAVGRVRNFLPNPTKELNVFEVSRLQMKGCDGYGSGSRFPSPGRTGNLRILAAVVERETLDPALIHRL